MSNETIEQRLVGDARELDDQRQVLAEELGDWRDAGAPPEAVVDAIEAFVEAKVDHMSNFPPRQRMIDKGSLEMPTGLCPGTTRGNLGANSPVQRLPAKGLTDEQIKHMVSRFLGWRLPENFSPDAGISFKPTFNEHMPFGPQKYNPSGTNLFDAQQAEAMVLYMIEGMP